MKKLIIAPSVLSLDFSNASEQLDELKNSKAQWIHYDVMDYRFVPNFTFGIDVMKGIQKRSEKLIDVHLMVNNPIEMGRYFFTQPITCLTIHYETLPIEKLIEFAQEIKSKSILAGLSFKPKTPLDKIKPILKYFDIVLVMGVEPGFGGQKFIETTPQTINEIYQYITNNNLDTKIEVDGGINLETAKQCIEAGAEILVAGSYVFKGKIKENIEKLCQLSSLLLE